MTNVAKTDRIKTKMETKWSFGDLILKQKEDERMQEYFELVQKGFRILVPALSGYLGQELNRYYQDGWWNEVLLALNNPRDLPTSGTYGELVDSLDAANCLRLIDRKWGEVFRYSLSPSCRAWAKELMGVRNIVAHIGNQDLDQPMAERALDTMALLCEKIDPESMEEIRVIYHRVRGERPGAAPVLYTGLAQPEAASVRGALKTGSLLQLVGTNQVIKTNETRRVVYGGKTVAYPVYKVALDLLYYNDQNDRIATWISRYETENGKDALQDLDQEIYNRIIEGFITESNSEAIRRTQNNISLVGQQVPGVTLADGRIVDGNRRYTCLRRLQRETKEPRYFETAILDMDIQEDRKQIKLLELAVQYGEEKKVEYDQIDFAVGTYRDVVQTKLLTVEEYAASTNETVAEVKKRIEIAQMVSEFLDYLKLPGQYHTAREYQVYGLFQEMMAPVKQLDDKGKAQMKTIVFNNTLMHAVADQRKFIRDIKSLIRSGNYETYFEENEKLGQRLQEAYAETEIHSKADADTFAEHHSATREELQISMERALLRSRSKQLKAKPNENITKSISLMMDVDPRQFSKMDPSEKETLKSNLAELATIVEQFRALL